MLDVIIAGAGPAGSLAALVLARAGARVLIVDRDIFPRDKLCGDTLNPGAIRLLESFGLAGGALAGARPLFGMRVSGPRGNSVRAVYGDAVTGVAIERRELDVWLLEHAIRAGARFESGLRVRRPLSEASEGTSVVRGLVVSPSDRSGELRLPARMTIAADGGRSTMARALGLTRRHAGARRWAFGVYATGVTGMTDLGEMHIRRGWYAGLAPLSASVTNICVVTGARPAGRTPVEVIRRRLATDPELALRTTDAEFVSAVRVLGPLAVEVSAPGTLGLLLAGDAAGFVDPMTGDGLHLAMRSAVLAAHETLTALETGDLAGAVARLREARRAAFGAKLRFNRTLRRIVGSPPAVDLASVGARIAPGLVRQAIRYAGDVL